MDSQNPSKGRSRRVALAMSAVALLNAAWSGAALGRTQTESECDRTQRDSETFGAPEIVLQVSSVDHVAIRSDAAAMESSDLESAGDDAAATPLLRLAPRVSSALRDVFDEGPATDVVEATQNVPASPVAESEDVKDVPESLQDETVPASGQDEDIDLPLLQRRMYRTDI